MSTKRGGPPEHQSRKFGLLQARRTARFTKAALALVGALVFGGAMTLSRHSYPGHPKGPTRPLGAPPGFVHTVRKNLLQAGIVAPAQAPPGASTSVS